MIPTIAKNCSDFLRNSNGNPLIKYLPKQKDGAKKIKIRKKQHSSEILELFNAAFPDYKNILNRCIFVNNKFCENCEPFYIFPTNGYKILYNEDITDTINYFDKLVSLLKNSKLQNDLNLIVKEQINGLYTNLNLEKAIQKGCEIIIYGIPYYYAVRQSIVEDYTQFLLD